MNGNHKQKIAKRLHWDGGNLQHIHYTKAITAYMAGAHVLEEEYLLHFSNTKEEGMTFCEQSCIFFLSVLILAVNT